MMVKTWRSALLILGETCLLWLTVAASAYIRLGEFGWTLMSDTPSVLRVLLIVGVCQMCLHFADLYDLQSIVDTRDLMVRLFQAIGATSLILAALYFWFPSLVIGRGVVLLAAILSIVVIVAWRLLFAWLARRVAPRERLLIVGTSPGAVELARELHERRQELGVEIVGFVDPDPERLGAAVLNPGVVGSIDDIPWLIPKLRADRVVVSLADARGKLPMDRLLDSRLQSGVSFDHLASLYEEYTGKIAVENLRPSWLIFSEGFSKSKALLAAKRLFDIVGAIAGLTLASPIMAIVAWATRLGSPGPALYHQERIGLGGRVFTVHKFRTMRQDAEAVSGPVWSVNGDPRVTRIGTFLRRTRIDELPQLWNILKGEMSLVGPRPERPGFVTDLTQKIPFYGQRHVIKPGLTGWAQVRYTYGASVEDAIQKLQYDLYYIKNMSIALDVVILLETIKTVILRRGAR